MSNGLVLDGPAKGEYIFSDLDCMQIPSNYGQGFVPRIFSATANESIHQVLVKLNFVQYEKIWDLSSEGKFYCWELLK